MNTRCQVGTANASNKQTKKHVVSPGQLVPWNLGAGAFVGHEAPAFNNGARSAELDLLSSRAAHSHGKRAKGHTLMNLHKVLAAGREKASVLGSGACVCCRYCALQGGSCARELRRPRVPVAVVMASRSCRGAMPVTAGAGNSLCFDGAAESLPLPWPSGRPLLPGRTGHPF